MLTLPQPSKVYTTQSNATASGRPGRATSLRQAYGRLGEGQVKGFNLTPTCKEGLRWW